MNVIITGASRGIGKAIATIFGANGYNLYISSRQEKTLRATEKELITSFPEIKVAAKAFDLGQKNQAQEFGDWCLGFGVPDIIVNNAGFFEPGSVIDEPEGVLENQLATNLLSAYHLTRRLLPAMIGQPASGHGRHIFNMCSIASLHAYANGGAYSISKFALYGFSKNLREELKPHGIKVTSVHPGAVLTDSWAGFDNSTKRIMEAEDIARMVFAASQLSVQACVEDIIIRPQLGDL